MADLQTVNEVLAKVTSRGDAVVLQVERSDGLTYLSFEME